MLERYKRVVDLGVFGIANLINVLLSVIFLVRAKIGTRGTPVESIAGWITVAMALPLITAIIVNIAAKRDAWLWILPLVTVVYLIVEFILDYALKIDFRSTSLLVPYLILYYLGQFAMVGYTFMIGKPYGFITLLTYFINLAATFYSYARVGHG
ncbi:MAG TPA: hypothetical protein PKZ84_03875 [Anaerolineae bacterium]|nr:hypothetical protein [Anaerolineae bacterium]HQI83479.1 hypothetical protein [Anaerolineae bacterium]